MGAYEDMAHDGGEPYGTDGNRQLAEQAEAMHRAAFETDNYDRQMDEAMELDQALAHISTIEAENAGLVAKLGEVAGIRERWKALLSNSGDVIDADSDIDYITKAIESILSTTAKTLAVVEDVYLSREASDGRW